MAPFQIRRVPLRYLGYLLFNACKWRPSKAAVFGESSAMQGEGGKTALGQKMKFFEVFCCSPLKTW
jgi:hypothetical protein